MGFRKQVEDRRNAQLFLGSLLATFATVLALASMTHAAPLPRQFNHSFDLDPTTATVCTDGAIFTGEPTAASSLGILMTSEVWNSTATVRLAIGDTHTFTMVGETYTFVVPGAFTVGDLVTLQVNNIPGTFPSTEGDAATATVADCSIAVPTVPGAGLLILTLLLLAGGAVFAARSRKKVFSRGGMAALVLLGLAFVAAVPASANVASAPGFSKEFMPDTIGPGSTAMLTFTIDNSDNPDYPVGMLAFSDTLPGGIDLAAPAFVSNTCAGTVTAPDGGDTISLTDGMVGEGQTCTIVVNVTGAMPGEGPYTNVSGDLTSDAGSSGSATDDLTITDSLPGFTKSFAPSTVPFGGRSTLTFTIDNSTECGECASDVEDLSFTDTLPAGMVVADPALASTTCGTAPLVATLVAAPGTSFISLSFDGVSGFTALAGEESCTVEVDVIGGAVGSLGNVSGELDADGVSAGKAAAVLEVTGVVDLLELSKEFTDDPAAPGGTTTLEFTVTNKSRDDAATAITFSDDIGATLAGLVPSGPLPTDPCGAGSSLAFTSGELTLTGGSLPPEGSCTLTVALTVPAGAVPGTYPNTAGPVSGDVGGSPETGNEASDLLFVVGFPILTKEFTDDPVGAGDSVTLEFTITNTDLSSTLSGITFLDELTEAGLASGQPSGGFLPFPVSVTLPPAPDPPCGATSSLALISLGTDRQGLSLTGGSLAETGMAGDSCTFSVTIDIPDGFPPGTYTNTTEEISAVLDDVAGTPTVVGPPAADDIEIAGPPQLIKEFVDDPVLPSGGPVTLEFTLRYSVGAVTDATAIAFTDDLTALTPAVPGLVAASVDTNTCPGATVDITTDPTMIDFSGGTLAPGAECTVALTLTVPASSPVGFHNNETSDFTALVGAIAVTGLPAEDDLLITPLEFTKDFLDDPVIAGDTVDLEFRIENLSPTLTASSVGFTDSLSAILPGTPDVTVVPPLPTLPASCGPGASLASIIPTSLSLTGGELTPGAVCSFIVALLVPAGVPDDEYLNMTSDLGSSLGTLPAASDLLTVDSTLLEITKEFTDDPVEPGDPVTLKFTLENLSATETVTDIAFDDDLDAVLTGLAASGASFNDCGGMAAGFPAGLFEYSGGTLMPGATCMIVLDVDVPAAPLASAPPYINTTTGVTGKVGTLDVLGEPASDELEVQLLKLTKSFDGPATATGSAVLTFTIDNLDPVSDAIGLAFSDDLDAVLSGLEVVLPPTPDPPCGAGSALAGTGFLTLTGASVPAGGSCSFDVTVTVPATATAGSFLNTTSELFSAGIPVADPGTDFLDVEPPPAFAKVFAPDLIAAGAVSTLTFTIDNTASAVDATGLDFTDNLPAGVVVAPVPNASKTCTGGMAGATAGGSVFSYGGGSVAAGTSCTVQVDVTSLTPGMHVNTTGDLTSSAGNSGTASDTLTVTSPPTFVKVFTPGVIGETLDTTLTFTIDNSASVLAATGLAFVDMLPFDLQVAAAPMVTNTCGGSVVAPVGSVSISLSGGSVAAGASCTISIQVFAPSSGTRVNTTGDLTSSSGNSGTASDTLTVVGCSEADGANLTLENLVLLVPETREVCNTIQVKQHVQVLGPNGLLTLRAGFAVIFFNGVSIEQNGGLVIEIDPALMTP